MRGLVLLRPLPKLKWYLAHLPEGPVIDWAAADLEQWLAPVLAHLKEQGAFPVKRGPPVVARRWSAEAVAATMLTVGEHVWYSHGASTNRKREAQPNNAIQWRMMCDAYQLGASVYDFRGITDTLDEGNHLLGLLRFKAGTGGQAVEYVVEWDYPLNKVLHKALDLYMAAVHRAGTAGGAQAAGAADGLRRGEPVPDREDHRDRCPLRLRHGP